MSDYSVLIKVEIEGMVIDYVLPGGKTCSMPSNPMTRREFEESNSKAYFLLESQHGIVQVTHQMSGHLMPAFLKSIKGKKVKVLASYYVSESKKKNHVIPSEVDSKHPIQVLNS